VGGGFYHDQPNDSFITLFSPTTSFYVRANPFFASVDQQLCYPTDKESMDTSHNHLAVSIKGLPFFN